MEIIIVGAFILIFPGLIGHTIGVIIWNAREQIKIKETDANSPC